MSVTERVLLVGVQTGPVCADPPASLEPALAALRALEPRPMIVVLPELFARPFWCVGLADTGYLDWAEPLDGPTVSAMRAEARRLHACIVVPFFERGPVEGQFFNSAAVVGPDGEVVPGRLPSGEQVPVYRKNAISSYRWDGHTNDEKFYFRPGDGFPIFSTPLGTLGVLICYDRWYPEAWRVLALQGAQVVCVPNASEGYVSDMFVPALRTCAAQNLVYAVGVNRAGVERVREVQTRYYGLSCVVGPRGEVLAQAPEADAGRVVVAEADLGRIGAERRRLWVYRDRRPELYGLVAATHSPPSCSPGGA
jgi:predicted amidohydrolase